MYTKLSPSFSEEGKSRLFSLYASVIILSVHEVCSYVQVSYYGVLYSMQIFLSYLLFDLFVRTSPLPRDALLHHTVGIFIVGFGLYELSIKKDFHVFISPFLRMEATTPFLHCAWILYNEQSVMNKSFAKVFFVLVLVLWIPFRLYYPTVTTYVLFGNVLTLEKQETKLGAPFFVSFCLLQYYWFAKLISVLIKTKKM
jgi:prolipoprotein diacylglyceryltransferase